MVQHLHIYTALILCVMASQENHPMCISLTQSSKIEIQAGAVVRLSETRSCLRSLLSLYQEPIGQNFSDN